MGCLGWMGLHFVAFACFRREFRQLFLHLSVVKFLYHTQFTGITFYKTENWWRKKIVFLSRPFWFFFSIFFTEKVNKVFLTLACGDCWGEMRLKGIIFYTICKFAIFKKPKLWNSFVRNNVPRLLSLKVLIRNSFKMFV